MALDMEVVASAQPLWHPSTTVEGKFYNGAVVEVRGPADASGLTPVHYFAVLNYGAGHSAQFSTGSIVLGSGRGAVHLAMGEVNAKMNGKRKGGYDDDFACTPLMHGSGIPQKVRAALENVVAGSAAFGPNPPAATGMPGAPSQPKPAATRSTPRRKAGAIVSNSQVIEKKAAAILQLANAEAALKALQALKVDVEAIRSDAADAESAFEMATLFVQSRL